MSKNSIDVSGGPGSGRQWSAVCLENLQESNRWSTNHVASLVSMDFFTVPTLTGRVLFVLVLLTAAESFT